jgi:hypothetical protein
MNPDVAQVIPEMVESGILEEEKASILLRVARGGLLSIQAEIRFLFYLGVLTCTAGAGLLIGDNYKQIGPLAVALFVGLAAAASFGLAIRKAPRFSWGEVPSPSLAFDYLLLLGVLLGAADLAFIEVQFTHLGAHWPWHLLITSILMACIAVRYDSRTIFSLSLSTFAAWRGVSVSLIEMSLWRFSSEPLRWNAIAVGILFVLLGRYLRSSRRKSHFEPASLYLGWLLVLGALVYGGAEKGMEGIAYILLLLAGSTLLARHSFGPRRFPLFTVAIVAAFIALFEIVLKCDLGFELAALATCCIAVGMIVVLWITHRTMKGSL